MIHFVCATAYTVASGRSNLWVLAQEQAMSPDHDPVPIRDDAAAQVDGASSTEADDADVETLRNELAELAQKADEYLRLAQRSQADFINYRRRVEDERVQQGRDATLAYIQRVLPILDDFERAIASGTPENLESSWGKGVQLVERNLRSLLAADDVQPGYRKGDRVIRPAQVIVSAGAGA